MMRKWFQFWRRRRKGSEIMRYDHDLINRTFDRIGGCMACGDYRSDMVKAKVCAYLIAAWDGQTMPPPSLADLQKHCCKALAEGLVREDSVTVDMAGFQNVGGKRPSSW